MSGDLTQPILFTIGGSVLTWIVLQFFKRIERSADDLPGKLEAIRMTLAEIDRKLAVLMNDYEHLEDRVGRIENDLHQHMHSFQLHMTRFHGTSSPRPTQVQEDSGQYPIQPHWVKGKQND